MSSVKHEGSRLVLSILGSCLPPLFVLALGVQQAEADTWQISAGNRNAWDDSFSGSINSCQFGDAFWIDSCGLAWAVTIPPGAKILSAKVRVYSNNHVGNPGAYTARIRVEDVDNAAVFTGAPNDVRGRTYWSTTVDWSIPAGGLPFPAWNESPDVTSLIQRIVDRPGWVSGNFINIAIWGQTNAGAGGAYEDISPFPTNPAELVVTYLPLQPLFRSVGTTATNLNIGGRTVQIAGSTATFSGPMPDNVGVGDVLAYASGGNQLAFIHGRTSSVYGPGQSRRHTRSGSRRDSGKRLPCLRLSFQLGVPNREPQYHGTRRERRQPRNRSRLQQYRDDGGLLRRWTRHRFHLPG